MINHGTYMLKIYGSVMIIKLILQQSMDTKYTHFGKKI